MTSVSPQNSGFPVPNFSSSPPSNNQLLTPIPLRPAAKDKNGRKVRHIAVIKINMRMVMIKDREGYLCVQQQAFCDIREKIEKFMSPLLNILAHKIESGRNCRYFINGRNILHILVIRRDVKMSNYLAEKYPALAKTKDRYGYTPFMYKAFYGIMEKIEEIMSPCLKRVADRIAIRRSCPYNLEEDLERLHSLVEGAQKTLELYQDESELTPEYKLRLKLKKEKIEKEKKESEKALMFERQKQNLRNLGGAIGCRVFFIYDFIVRNKMHFKHPDVNLTLLALEDFERENEDRRKNIESITSDETIAQEAQNFCDKSQKLYTDLTCAYNSISDPEAKKIYSRYLYAFEKVALKL